MRRSKLARSCGLQSLSDTILTGMGVHLRHTKRLLDSWNDRCARKPDIANTPCLWTVWAEARGLAEAGRVWCGPTLRCDGCMHVNRLNPVPGASAEWW